MSLKTIVILFLTLFALGSPSFADGQWSGIDESIVEKHAEEAGRPARDPYINTDRGDLLLFMFGLGGAIAGFIGGYYFRVLFSEKSKLNESKENV